MFLRVRVVDQRVLPLIWQILESGVIEDRLELASEERTPEGGSPSATLSNVYLPYVLDLWFERRFKPSYQREAHLFRFADDFLVCFQYESEARRFLRALKQRMEKFHLEISASKTKLLAFGRPAQDQDRQVRRKLQTFAFLGFTHYCRTTRSCYFKVARRTSLKKFHANRPN